MDEIQKKKQPKFFLTIQKLHNMEITKHTNDILTQSGRFSVVFALIGSEKMHSIPF